MKTFFFTLAALFVSFASIANGNKTNNATCTVLAEGQMVSTSTLQANVFQTAGDRLSLILIQPEAQPITVQLRDADESLIYKQTITETGARQNLDLRQLDKGSYTLTLRSGDQCFVRSIEKK